MEEEALARLREAAQVTIRTHLAVTEAVIKVLRGCVPGNVVNKEV